MSDASEEKPSLWPIMIWVILLFLFLIAGWTTITMIALDNQPEPIVIESE